MPVDVDERLDLPGLPAMELAGIVYHHGATLESGHYTCACRGPGGRFCFFDDHIAVAGLREEVSRVKPREVFMLAYCRVDGSADWQAEAGLSSMGDSGGVALGDVAGPGASAVDAGLCVVAGGHVSFVPGVPSDNCGMVASGSVGGGAGVEIGSGGGGAGSGGSG